MKKSKNIWGNIIIGVFLFLVLAPLLTILVWVFTERWAWPDLIPQTFSLRAVESVFRDRVELGKLFGSSMVISLTVAFLSVVIGTMTARALECYEFIGKKAFSFLALLPFLVPATVFAMGIQVAFIKAGLSGKVLRRSISGNRHSFCTDIPAACHKAESCCGDVFPPHICG